MHRCGVIAAINSGGGSQQRGQDGWMHTAQAEIACLLFQCLLHHRLLLCTSMCTCTLTSIGPTLLLLLSLPQPTRRTTGAAPTAGHTGRRE